MDQLQGIVYPDGYTSPDEESSEDEASDDQDVEEGEIMEESDEEDQAPGDELAATFSTNDVTPVILRIIIQKQLEVFPYHGDLQHVNEDKFLNMVDEIRRAVSGVPIVQGSINYGRIITERLPFGSRFTAQGGYTTPDGIVICRVLRNKMKTLQEEFADEARTQRPRAGVRFQPSSPTLGRGSLFEQDMAARPLIERQYMVPARLPTLSPSPQERFLGESADEYDSGN